MTGKLYAGASGFSYPSWKGGFYPADAKAEDFLRLYSERVNAVELNNTFYRVPPGGSVRPLGGAGPGRLPLRGDGQQAADLASGASRAWTSSAAWRAASATGWGRCASRCRRRATTGSSGSCWTRSTRRSPVALDFRHGSWDDPEVTARLDERGVARAGAWDGAADFRYLRLREPPYDEAALAALADRVRPLVTAGVDVYAFFRHEDEPTAPLYAERLRALVGE